MAKASLLPQALTPTYQNLSPFAHEISSGEMFQVWKSYISSSQMRLLGETPHMCVWSNIAYITHVLCVCPSVNDARSQPVPFLAASACVLCLVSEVDTFFPTPMSALKITNWLENLMKVVSVHLAPNFSSFPSPISSTITRSERMADGWWWLIQQRIAFCLVFISYLTVGLEK